MRELGVVRRYLWRGVGVFLACFLALGCTESTSDDAAEDDSTAAASEVADVGSSVGIDHAESLATLTALLPADSRGVVAIDVEGLLSSGSSVDTTALLSGQGSDPAFSELFGAVGAMAATVDVPGSMSTALISQTTDPVDGRILLATLRSEDFAEVMVEPVPTDAGTYGPNSRPLYLDATGNHLTLLPGGVLIVGARAAVESVVDIADGVNPAGASAIVPFLDALVDDADLSFAYGLPALFGDVAPDRTLRSAAVVSGAFDVADDEIGGVMAFHTSNAAEFVEAYNGLNQPSTVGDQPLEQPLDVAGPLVEGLEQVVLTIPPSPLDPSLEEANMSRNVFKKLFVGMEAHDYAEGVSGLGNPPWFDFRVRSERDEDSPESPGSVFIRWEFRDQAAIEAFEENELPAGFTLAPTRFLESDNPEGEYFLALNLYNTGGDSIVGGMRAEWDVFVHPPEGADPNAGERPRFMVVDALAEEVSADPDNLLTPAEPLSHAFVDGAVVSSVRRFEAGSDVPVFESTFPTPDPSEVEVARFTREMAIGNDYIYWAHGVSDRVLYNATTFNHDAYLIDTERIRITDESRWAQYLQPEVKDAVYYVNSLEYVASPMANLDSDHLDITPEWLAELLGFTNNGHQRGVMRSAVEKLFLGQGDALVGRHVANETPATYFNFEITAPEALEATLDLPSGHRLAPTTLFEGGEAAYYLTLSVFEFDDAIEGMRAEWSVYTDDGDGRPPSLMVLDLMTAEVGFDPVSIINLPSEVSHSLADGVVSTRLSSSAITFDASFSTTGVTDHDLALDWIEAGDDVCHVNGVCDKFYYDAETLDVPVHQPAEVAVNEFSTPWSEFISEAPTVVFYRDNAQEYAVMGWYNLDIMVEELPFSGLEDPTHSISGSGALTGRDSDLVDSDYTYTGDVVVEGDQLTFAIDQQVDNTLGVAHIYTTGSFELSSGTGTQTVVDCVGPGLLCSDIESGSTTFFGAQELDASDPDSISWQVNVVVDLGGSFGTADSASTFVATRDG